MNEPNAALIAAAPELLQAAKWALQQLDGLPPELKNYTVIGALEDAIAKAEGRS